MEVCPILDMPHLGARLSPSKINRIQYFPRASTKKQVQAKNIPNTVIHKIQNHTPNDAFCKISDILEGVSVSFETGTKSLNIQFLYDILQCVELINTREVRKLLQVTDRQASKYVRAISFALPRIQSILGD